MDVRLPKEWFRTKAADVYFGLNDEGCFAACPLGGVQKRKGDFSCEISPSHFRFSEIRFGFQITTLVIPESLGTHEQQPVLLHSLFGTTLVARASCPPSFSSYPDRASLPSLEDDC